MWRLGLDAAVLLALAATVGIASSEAARQMPAVKEFDVVAERFTFTPQRLVVNQGDTVRIRVRSADVTHGFEIKKLDVDDLVPKGGRLVTFEFTADEAGTFPITCSEYCGRGHEKMKGVLEVQPAGSQGGAR